MNEPRYYAQEFRPGHWHICDRENGNRPIYDNAPYGNDRPVIFKDEDWVMDVVHYMNHLPANDQWSYTDNPT